MFAATLEVIASATGTLLLHAGLVAAPQGIVVHGPSGVGKTSLTVALATQGLAYLTDETVCLDPVTLQIEPFRKPLTVKPGSQHVLAHLEPAADRIDPHSGNWHVDPDALLAHGAVPLPDTPLYPALIVFPDFDPDATSLTVEPVSRARAAFLLGEQSSALWAVEPRPLAALQRLVSLAPAYRITYGNAFDAAPVIVDELLGDAPDGAPDAEALGVSDDPPAVPTGGVGPARATGIDWIELDGEAVLFDGTHLHHLDPPGAAVWQRLDGQHSETELAADLARRFGAPPHQVQLDVEDLVRVLRSRGLVA